MGDNSAIEWTEATWNPVTGCDKVSPGCAHCYAERVFPRAYSKHNVDVATATGTIARPRKFTDVVCHEDRLDHPLRWRRPRKVFVNSMSDLFHEDVSDAFIDRVFAVMALAPPHTFQILTKRAERMREYLSHPARREVITAAVAKIRPDRPPRHWYYIADSRVTMARWPLANVWLGVSVENQRFADERIPLLLQTPAAVRFISAEPLLGPVDLHFLWSRLLSSGPLGRGGHVYGKLDWVIVGGESGAGARPCATEWIESIVQQCRAASVPCFVKQLGAYVVSEERTAPAEMFSDTSSPKLLLASNGEAWAWRAGLKDKKGGDPAEWPEDLRVREFPAERKAPTGSAVPV